MPAGTPGFLVEPAYRKMGWHASDTHGLRFEDCRVPAANLLGERGRGFRQFLAILDDGRVAIAAMAVGIAQGCLEHSVAYAKERQAFGRPIGANQGVAFRCADMAVAVEAARLLTYRAAWLRDRGRPFRQEAAMAKLYASEIAVDATRHATQIFGGYGYRGRVPGVPLLPRRQGARDRRGHQRDPAAGHRPGPGPAAVGGRRRRAAAT